jgi:ParB family chromosome partitioning protein
MGRGLAAILPEAGAGGPELRELPLDRIEPNPQQPRNRIEPDSLRALADSISEAGVLQPVIVRPTGADRYELVAGERRWRAAQRAGLGRIPAIVRESPSDQRLQSALIENMAREDLNPVDEARACASLVDDLGISKEELARRVGRSRVAISNLIRLLDLPDQVLKLLAGGELSEGHGRAILQERDQDKRRKLAARAAREGWSVRETERRAKGDGRPARRTRPVSADEKAVIAEAEDELSSALGADLKVRASGSSLRAVLEFEDLAELRALARRLRRRS